MQSSLFFSLALISTFVLAAYDHKTGRMPNWLTLSSWACALGLHGLAGGVEGLLLAFLSGFFVAAAPLGLFLLTKGEAIGGGDVKALLGIGAWIGPLAGLHALLLSLLLLAAFAYWREARRRQLWPLLKRSLQLFSPSGHRAPLQASFATVRFGPFLAVGTTVTVLANWLQGVLTLGGL